MFQIACGRLIYRPFEHYELPVLLPDLDDHNKGRSVSLDHHEEPLVVYRLSWPGQHLGGPASIPWEEVKEWPNASKLRIGRKGEPKHFLLSDLVKRGVLPDEMPESLSYHFAVNRHAYPHVSVKHVAGLPIERVRQVLDARFALDATYIAGIQYMRQLALNHRDHPLLRYFDTLIRDRLADVGIIAVRNYFMLLGDCIYDEHQGAFARGTSRDWWDRMACYLHWVGRTGRGLYTFHSELATDERTKARMRNDIPDVLEGIEAEMNRRRSSGKKTGKERGSLGRLSRSWSVIP